MLIPAVRCIVHQTLTCKTVSPEVSELDLSSVLVWTFCFCLQVFCDETSIANLSSGAPGMRLKLVFGSGSVFVLEICPQPGGEMVSKQRAVTLLTHQVSFRQYLSTHPQFAKEMSGVQINKHYRQ